MRDLIDKQEAIDALGEEPEVWMENDEYARGLKNQWRYDVNALKAVPSVQPERKKGKWVANGDIPKECPFCGEDWDKYVFGEVWYTDELPKFCPNCGADCRGS